MNVDVKWKYIKLGLVCKTGAGGTPLKSKKEYYANANIPWLLSGEVNNRNITESKNFISKLGLENSSARIFPKNSVLIAMYGATAGQVGILRFEAASNQAVCAIYPNDTFISEFLYYFFLNEKERLIAKAVGNAQPNISQVKIKDTEVPIIPIEEQQTIVAKLDQAFAAIDQAKANIEKNITNAKELFQSKLNQIFAKNTLSTLSENNEGWEIKTLGELGKVSMCKRILKNQTLPKGEIPFYKIGTFGKEPDAYISKEIFEEYSTKYSYPKKGQILLSASGTIGRTVIFDGKPSFFQDSNIVWIDNNEDKVLNDFLYQFYKVCDWNPSKGATISRLYNDDLRRIKISFPNIEEQKRLIPQIEKLQEQTNLLVTKYHQKLANLEELKKSILEKAFKGELTTQKIEV
ncbi:MAG: restriction endonuclease subunit S [Flavobacteriales bacterium]|nr:restriction endonuclease subunit S [Flavobacteriales bacterium]